MLLDFECYTFLDNENKTTGQSTPDSGFNSSDSEDPKNTNNELEDNLSNSHHYLNRTQSCMKVDSNPKELKINDLRSGLNRDVSARV